MSTARAVEVGPLEGDGGLLALTCRVPSRTHSGHVLLQTRSMAEPYPPGRDGARAVEPDQAVYPDAQGSIPDLGVAPVARAGCTGGPSRRAAAAVAFGYRRRISARCMPGPGVSRRTAQPVAESDR